jgi:hypothetical protein
MESKESRQIDEFKVMDEHGNDYTVVEYQNVAETRSLKWRRAGPSWFGLADGARHDTGYGSVKSHAPRPAEPFL